MKHWTTTISLAAGLFCATGAIAQDAWQYQPDRTISFAEADTMAVAYKAAIDGDGNLWVISSPESFEFPNLFARALFRAAPEETEFAKVEEYDRTVRAPNGITAIGNDIFVSSREGFDGNDAYHPYSLILRYPDGDPTARERYEEPDHKDYGSWVLAATASGDGFLYVSRSWRMTIMTIDFQDGSETWGHSRPAAETPDGPMEARGGIDAWGSDLIRSIALLPNGNYSDPGTPVYTARNSSMGDPNHRTGGISEWTGGTQTNPGDYRARRVEDLRALLDFDADHPYGIALDADGILYVAGTDENRRWVKAFEVVEGFAIEREDLGLPSNTSADLPDPEGAPFVAPSDVVFTPDMNTAYVADKGARQVFVFTREFDVSARESAVPESFALHQNYPNPFNPVTRITFSLAHADHVRLAVYDALGRKIALLVDGFLPAGTHGAVFSGVSHSSGLYTARLTTSGGSRAIKMNLVR